MNGCRIPVLENKNSGSVSGITVLKYFDQLCLLIAFFKIPECFPEGCVSYKISVFQETEKSNYPQSWPQNRNVAGFWKADLHLYMTFPEAGDQVDLLVGGASHQCGGNICTHIPILQNSGNECFAVLGTVMNLRIYCVRKAQIDAAGFQNNFIKMADPGFPAPRMKLIKMNVLFMLSEIKYEIAEQTDSETTVKVMLKHVVDHVKHILGRGKNRVWLAVYDVCIRLDILS